MNHIAIIPARAGSVGLPGKNRMFFPDTAKFIRSVPWIDRVVVSTDDEMVSQMAVEQDYEIHQRPEHLAGPDVSIRAVFENLFRDMEISDEDVLWLFYLPLAFKDRDDFEQARTLIETGACDSLIGLRPALSHPYSCWAIGSDGSMHQYVGNDVFRRQDMPPAWTHHHYLCCFRKRVFADLNSELIGPATYPFRLAARTVSRLVEIDTPEDLERWRRLEASHTGSN